MRAGRKVDASILKPEKESACSCRYRLVHFCLARRGGRLIARCERPDPYARELRTRTNGVQVKNSVKLPSDPLIEFLDFCRAIAEAVYPTGEEGLEGIDCVIAKIVSWHDAIPEFLPPMSSPYYRAWQNVLVDEDGRTLNELFPDDRPIQVVDGTMELPLGGSSSVQIGEVSLPAVLSEDDRLELAEVLRHLPGHVPALRYPMSEDERAVFLEAYCNMPNRPMWTPLLVTEETIKMRKDHRDAELRRHQQALQQEFKAGRLTPVNAGHSPVATLMAGTFIPRAQAVLYLERHGLAYDHGTASQQEKDVAPVCDGAIEVIQVGDADQVSEFPPSDTESKKVGVSKASPSERKAAVELYSRLKGTPGVENFLEQVAQKYGVTPRTVTNWVKADEPETQAQELPRTSPFCQAKRKWP